MSTSNIVLTSILSLVPNLNSEKMMHIISLLKASIEEEQKKELGLDEYYRLQSIAMIQELEEKKDIKLRHDATISRLEHTFKDRLTRENWNNWNNLRLIDIMKNEIKDLKSKNHNYYSINDFYKMVNIVNEQKIHNYECPICLDNENLDNKYVTPCGHIFCKDCLHKSINANKRQCPKCRLQF
jgi:hypothetical protein